MSRYRKLPVEVEASRWFENGDHPDDGECHIEGAVVRYYRTPGGDGEKACNHCGCVMRAHGWIDTPEGGHIVCPGDYVITGVAGERYPCKPAIFEATYEPAEEEG